MIFSFHLTLAQNPRYSPEYLKKHGRDLDETEQLVVIMPNETIYLKQNKTVELKPLALRKSTAFTFYMTESDKLFLGDKFKAVSEGIDVWNRTGHPGIKIGFEVVKTLPLKNNIIKNISCYRRPPRVTAYTKNHYNEDGTISHSVIKFCKRLIFKSYEELKFSVSHEVAHALGMDHLLANSATSLLYDYDVTTCSYGFFTSDLMFLYKHYPVKNLPPQKSLRISYLIAANSVDVGSYVNTYSKIGSSNNVPFRLLNGNVISGAYYTIENLSPQHIDNARATLTIHHKVDKSKNIKIDYPIYAEPFGSGIINFYFQKEKVFKGMKARDYNYMTTTIYMPDSQGQLLPVSVVGHKVN